MVHRWELVVDVVRERLLWQVFMMLIMVRGVELLLLLLLRVVLLRPTPVLLAVVHPRARLGAGGRLLPVLVTLWREGRGRRRHGRGVLTRVRLLRVRRTRAGARRTPGGARRAGPGRRRLSSRRPQCLRGRRRRLLLECGGRR